MIMVFFIIVIIKLIIINIFHIQLSIFTIPFIQLQLNVIFLKQLNVFILLQFYDAFLFHIHVIVFAILSYKLNKQLVIFFSHFLLTFFYIILLTYAFVFQLILFIIMLNNHMDQTQYILDNIVSNYYNNQNLIMNHHRHIINFFFIFMDNIHHYLQTSHKMGTFIKQNEEDQN